MISIQFHHSQVFQIKYCFVVYGYDPITRSCKVPVYELFTVKFNMLNPSQHTVAAISNHLMTLKPAVFLGVRNFPGQYLVHHVLPQSVYPCNPASDVKIVDLIKRYKTYNPLSDTMIITVNVIEKHVDA